MLQGLLRQGRDVHAPHDHLHPAAAEMVGDFVGAGRGGGHRGDAHEVGGLVQVQRLDLFVLDRYLPTRRA